jgi:hypothetical protein
MSLVENVCRICTQADRSCQKTKKGTRVERNGPNGHADNALFGHGLRNKQTQWHCIQKETLQRNSRQDGRAVKACDSSLASCFEQATAHSHHSNVAWVQVPLLSTFLSVDPDDFWSCNRLLTVLSLEEIAEEFFSHVINIKLYPGADAEKNAHSSRIFRTV